MTNRGAIGSVPRELQVYVLRSYLPDTDYTPGGEIDRNPRAFVPRKVVEHLDLPDRVRRRLPDPLPQLLQSARTEGRPIEMVADREPYPGAPFADYSAWDSDNFLVFSRRAADALRALLAPAGTFIPLECREADLVGYMLDAADDVLDAGASQIDWRTSKGSRWIMKVDRYAFHTEKLGRFAMFRPTGPALNPPLVLQPFVDVVRSQPFTGFNFCRVWPAGEERWWHHGPWI